MFCRTCRCEWQNKSVCAVRPDSMVFAIRAFVCTNTKSNIFSLIINILLCFHFFFFSLVIIIIVDLSKVVAQPQTAGFIYEMRNARRP